MVSKKNCNKVSTLLKKIKALKINSCDDISQLSELSEAVLQLWVKMKNKYRKHIPYNLKFNVWLHAEYEAEEEIVIGLLNLINRKLIDHIYETTK